MITQRLEAQKHQGDLLVDSSSIGGQHGPLSSSSRQAFNAEQKRLGEVLVEVKDMDNQVIASRSGDQAKVQKRKNKLVKQKKLRQNGEVEEFDDETDEDATPKRNKVDDETNADATPKRNKMEGEGVSTTDVKMLNLNLQNAMTTEKTTPTPLPPKRSSQDLASLREELFHCKTKLSVVHTMLKAGCQNDVILKVMESTESM